MDELEQPQKCSRCGKMFVAYHWTGNGWLCARCLHD